MGFWSSLAHIAGPILAPFTFGASMIPAAVMDIKDKNWLGLGLDAIPGLGGAVSGSGSLFGIGRSGVGSVNDALSFSNAMQPGNLLKAGLKNYGTYALGQSGTNAMRSLMPSGGTQTSSSGIPDIYNYPMNSGFDNTGQPFGRAFQFPWQRQGVNGFNPYSNNMGSMYPPVQRAIPRVPTPNRQPSHNFSQLMETLARMRPNYGAGTPPYFPVPGYDPGMSFPSGTLQ